MTIEPTKGTLLPMANPEKTPTPSDTEKPSLLTLQQALKVLGFALTGGEAKHMIQEGHVTVNGEVDTRRKKKIQEGDEICFQGDCYVIELDD